MTAPTLTYGDGHLEDFIDIWDWDYESEATSDGAAGKTTTIDSTRTEADDTWNGYYIKFLSGDNAGYARKITDFDQGTTTFTHVAFPNQTLDGDEYVLSKFVETLSNMANGDVTPALNPEDVLELQGAFDDISTEEYGYLEFTLPTSLDSDVYTKCFVRHKSSHADQDCRVVLVFSAGTQTVVNDDASTTWKVTETTITASKTITGFRVYVYNAADDASPETYKAYYDFVKICKNKFTFPHVASDGKSGGIYPQFTKRIVKTKIPGRDLVFKEDMGIEDIIFRLKGDVLQGESWGTPILEYLLDAMRNDEWCWFTSDRGNFKVIIASLVPNQSVESGAVGDWELVLEIYSYSDLGDSIWDSKDGWLGIES